MVGVGGRSKACSNCRHRRIKCDETRPKCRRCGKAELECGGYPSITIIQYDGTKEAKDGLGSRDASEELSGLVPDRAPHGTSQVHSVMLHRRGWITIPEDDILTSYTFSHLLKGQDQDPIVNGIGNNLTKICFLALSTTFFGAEHKETSLVQRGLHRYCFALKELQKALGDQRRHDSVDLPHAVVVMALFEFLVSEHEQGWISHARGLETLFELRGPESFASPAALFVLERSRLSSIFAALVLHRPTIFAQPCWKYIPWGLSPDRKTPLQYLLDIMADCPDLFVSKDRVCTGVAEQQTGSEYKLLAGRAQRLLEDLCQWEQTWTALHSECSHEHLSPPTTPTFTDPRGRIAPIWSTVLQYKSWYHASAVTLYNSTRILLVKFILSLSRPKDEFSAEDQDLSEAMLASGLTICRSVDFCLEEISAGEGSFSLLFSLRMAFDAVGRSNQEIRAWLRAILHRISSGSVSRWPAAKYVLEINASMI